MNQPKLIIWDFDGVLCDSLFECITVTKLAASRIAEPGLVITQQNLHELCHPELITPLYKRMGVLRPFIVKGQDYLWQYFNLEHFGTAMSNSTDYRCAFDAVFDAEQDRRYEVAFYESRKFVQSLMQQQYFNLFRPYSGVLYAFRAARLWYRTYICTARDQAGVTLLLGNNGITFPPEKIFAKDFNAHSPNPGLSKTEQILRILDQEGGREQPFLLIEDQIKAPGELMEVCPRMEVIYAAYGYGLEQDWKAAGLKGLKTIRNSEDIFHNIY